MRYYLLCLVLCVFFACKKESSKSSTTNQSKTEQSDEVKVDNNSGAEDDLSDISTKDFREFKVLDSDYINTDELWSVLGPQMEEFSQEDHDALSSMILEQDMYTIQKHISDKNLTYENLVKFFLFRIQKYDRENSKSLNSVIALNPNVIEDAKQADILGYSNENHAVFGMPILLKDNINASDMSTTAGAMALYDNKTSDAFIVQQLKDKGALILGKANLSEWAYFFCGDCPSGYSAVGGQTLNPYGRRAIDTGGSSSGSGVSVAANFCVAAVGSETSGSILSPSSQNSVVGLKPTIGLLSRSGIVPISSTLDTPGPMTKNVIDNAILLDAMFGEDEEDSKSFMIMWESGFYTDDLEMSYLKDKRFGVPKRLLTDTLFVDAIKVLKDKGAEIVEIDEEQLGLPNFLRLLNLDMKKDLPDYMEHYANKDISLRKVSDVIKFNLEDSTRRMPYGQRLFEGIAADQGDSLFLERIKDTLKMNGKQYFNVPMERHKLDGFLSINNYHAGYAAVAEYPALTVPMGYTDEGEPKGLTFIAKRLQEKQLLQWAYVYEQASQKRIPPKGYD
ncbi:amidase family protein [Winogradskyella sp. 3972H.M.0a.05]|uniref:amidase family protein n=1 Tax=Winogradskyella sp. 3972H.M.0a.05 TaxID=2950277 RepID=UPI00339303CF